MKCFLKEKIPIPIGTILRYNKDKNIYIGEIDFKQGKIKIEINAFLVEDNVCFFDIQKGE